VILFLEHPIHTEHFAIPEETQKLLNSAQDKILAVGTTVTRTVEPFCNERKRQKGRVHLFANPSIDQLE